MKNTYTPIALLLIGIGLLLGPELNSIKGTVTVAIIEETADRPKLPATQIELMTSTTFGPAVKAAGGTFLGCFDKDITDHDKKQPAELAPYIQAAEKLPNLPALVYKRGSKVTAIALPPDENTALEKLK
jgi:hypothetical protein